MPDRNCNDGTFYWCETGAGLLLFEAYEQARGHRTYLLCDLAICGSAQADYRVLLSIEPTN